MCRSAPSAFISRIYFLKLIKAWWKRRAGNEWEKTNKHKNSILGGEYRNKYLDEPESGQDHRVILYDLMQALSHSRVSSMSTSWFRSYMSDVNFK